MAVGNCRLQAYNVEKKIGQGSYGEVFLVTTQNDKKKVCASVIVRRRPLLLLTCGCSML